MTVLTDRIAEVLIDALETGLAHPHQRNLVAIEGELDLDELATHLTHEVAEALHLEQILVKEGEIPPLYAIEGWMRGLPRGNHG